MVDRQQLYKDEPPMKTRDYPILRLAKRLKSIVVTTCVPLNHLVGGPEYNLLALVSKGVYIVCSTIRDKRLDPVTHKSRLFTHCFVYNSDSTLIGYADVVGSIIDNRIKAGRRYIKSHDRETRHSARRLLSDFFQGEVFVTKVFKLTPV